MVARSRAKLVVVPHVFGVTLPVAAAAKAEVIADYAVIMFPHTLSMARLVGRYEEKDRSRSGHKHRGAYRFWYPHRLGAGARKPRYKTVRRGGILHRKHVRV
jgi:hypothetical protein